MRTKDWHEKEHKRLGIMRNSDGSIEATYHPL